MIATIVNSSFKVYQWVSSDNTICSRLLDTFIDWFDVFLWNYTTNNGINEFVSFTSFQRFNAKVYVTVLSTSTRLTNELMFCFGHLLKAFFVSNLWLTNVSFNFKFALHTIYKNFKVKFTHTSNNSFLSFSVRANFECRIFFSKFLHRNTHFFLVSFCLRLNRHRNNWFSELDLFKFNWRCFCTKCICSNSVFWTYQRTNVTSKYFLNFIALVSTHTYNTTNTFFVS